MHAFIEYHPEFNGFSKYYSDSILPDLRASEVRRQKAVKSAKIYFAIAFLMGVLVGGYVFIQTRQWPFVIFMGVAGLVVGWAAATYAMASVKKETKTQLVTRISDYLGWNFTEKAQEPRALIKTLFKNRLLQGRYHRANFEDQITGKAHGAAFVMTEAHLEREDTDSDGKSSWVTVFRGQLIQIDFNRKFLGRTVVLRDRRFFQSKAVAGMKRVGLVDPVFEKIFEAYGTDQVEARYLLTPSFMQRLVDLEARVQGNNIRFGFIEGQLLIVIETPNRFESGSMFKPLTDPARTQKILDEFRAVIDVIDGVMKPGVSP